MNPNDQSLSDSGTGAARAQDSRAFSPESHLQDGMKRAAAKQLIEAYYFQLTDGCGDVTCTNDACASCPDFTLKDRDRNVLALQAVELFKNKATLCESERNKVARLPEASTATASLALQTKSAPATPDQKHGIMVPSTSQASSGPSKSAATTPTSSTDVPFLSEEKLEDIISLCRRNNDWSVLIKTTGLVFSDPDSLIKSFRKKVLKEQLREMEHDSDRDVDDEEKANEDLESGETIPVRTLERVSDVSVDLASLQRAYKLLMDTPDQPFQTALINALMSLSRQMELDLRYSKRFEQDTNYINIFVIVMEIPLLHSPEFIDSAFPSFCKALGQLSLPGQIRLAKYWSQFEANRLTEMVLSLQQLITVKLINGESRWGRGFHVNDEDYITGPTKVMKILYYASLLGGKRDPQALLEEEREIAESEEHLQHELLGASAMGIEAKEPRPQNQDPLGKELDVSHMDVRTPLVPYDDFVNETLNEYINIETDYKYKLESDEGKFSFVGYSFILNPASKQMSLYVDNRIQMYKERRSSILQTIIHGMPAMPYLRIRVSRDRIIDDALVALEMVAMENPVDLKKQLFVEFDGEQGLDEGGVSKEFFQLVVEEIFNIDFGMFTYNEETRQFWFNSMSFENDAQFTLIGIVLGLAIYNSTIVDVHFPSVVYRKLVGKKGTYEDLPDVDPTLAKSLQSLLDYSDDDLADTFMMTFQIGYKDVFGSSLTYDLKERGETLPVTQENKQEFVDLYSDYVLNKSIEKQFRAFRRGFHIVTNESPLRTLFRPSEIELLICGSENLDFYALEEATEYDAGFDKHSTTVKHFWEVVHDFGEEEKRRLLQFTTGTDRVPVGGLSKLKLIIARNGPDSDRLPTAHTCFNVLLLPDYENKTKLEERLLIAITNSKGFGML